ncbi:MAG: hypothetical protein GY861_02475 [bacterium]|nr:hypothetical protein [bacterium]
MKKKAYMSQNKENIKTVLLSYEAVDWDERGLRKETLETFGVRCKISTEIGPTVIEKAYFPYYSQEGKLCGYKVKDLTKDKHEKGHFYTIGHVGVDCQLFGQKECKGPTLNLKITEGEVDQLSAYQALLDRQLSDETPEKYRNLKPQVVSIGCGTVHATDHISHNAEFIDEYTNIWLAFDNDELSDIEKKKKNPGMKGKECTESVGAYLIYKNVFVIQWPDYFNDSSDALQKGKSEELAKILLFDKKKFRAENIIKFSDVMTFEDAHKPIERGFQSYSFPILSNKLLGFRDYEMTTLATFSNVGKSTVAFDIAADSVKQGYKPGLIFLEEMPKKTLFRAEAWKLKVHPNKYKFDPYGCGKSKEEIKEAWEWANDSFRIFNHFGSIKTQSLMEKVRFLHFNLGCNPIVFDHISLAVSGRADSQNDTKELDIAMTEIGAFCASNPIHFFNVSHVNRLASAGFKRSDKPEWRRFEKEYLRGSSSLEGVSWNIIGIHREDLPDGSRGRIQLSLLKDREADWIGDVDITKMHPETGRFYDASEEEWQPKGGGY